MGRTLLAGALCLLLFGSAVGLAIARERLELPPPPPGTPDLMYVRSTTVAPRLALSYDALAADLYWIRAIQHYGGTRLSNDPAKAYDRLYPLLDLATSLDPHFNIAYRFGAIFLAEPFPAGAGRPDQAITLLMKGLAVQPDRWEFAHDIGFVHYWFRRDYVEAAGWFLRAAAIPGSPDWLTPLAAQVQADGGNRAASRELWRRILETAESDWLRAMADTQLRRLDGQ